MDNFTTYSTALPMKILYSKKGRENMKKLIAVLLVPILLPAVMAYGVNPIQFGVVVIFNLMIGILTPPMGTALFVVSRVGNIQFKTLVKGVLPFLIPLIITLILLNVFPQITLFLPTLLTGGV